MSAVLGIAAAVGLVASLEAVASPPTNRHVVLVSVRAKVVPARDVANLEMFTARHGVAVASEAPRDRPRAVYLLSTVDGGILWSVTGALPARLAGAVLATRSGFDLVATELAFENPEIGYLAVRPPERSEVVLYTADGGARWRTVATPGSATGISLDEGRLWAVSDVCPGGNTASSDCRSELLTYRFGRLRPTSVKPMPVETPDVVPESHLLRRIGPTAAVFTSDGTAGYPHDLMMTTDAGRSWEPVTDPCRDKTRMSPSGLVATEPDRWLLLCEIDGGMENYDVRLFSTRDSGTSWRLVGERNITLRLPQVGRLVAGLSFTASGDGRTLWLLGPVAGVSWSLDGGLDWTSLQVATGGGFHDLVAAGASEAWFALPWQGLYFTRNGATWRRLS